MAGGKEQTPGRRSWREKADAAPKAPAAAETGGEGGATPAAAARPARKPARAETAPLWYRLALPVAAFLVLVAIVALMLWQLQKGPSVASVTAEAVAVTEYRAPIPLNHFADRDLAAVQKSSIFAVPTGGDRSTRQTIQRLREIFDGSMQPAAGAETLVVYLSAHGICDENEAYLLTSEAQVESKEGWFPLRTVLEGMAKSGYANKLLILDAGRIDADVDLGVLGNDFVHHLKNTFEQANKTGNFWVLCSSDEGRLPWVWREKEHSVFGLASAYALSGGKQADRPDERGRSDHAIDAAEICAFVKDQVTEWATKSGRTPPEPVLLQFGESFAVVGLKNQLSLDAFLASLAAEPEHQAATTETPAEAAPAEKAADAAAEKPAEKADTKAEPPKPVLTLAAVRGQLTQAFADRARLESAAAAAIVRRPDQWNWYQQRLLRAEQLSSAGQLLLANSILSKLDQAESDLAAAADAAPATDWSLVELLDQKPAPKPADGEPKPPVDPERANRLEFLTQQRSLIEPVLKAPTDDNLKPLQDNPLVEAALLRLLARKARVTDGKAWEDAALVQTILEVRQQSERTARLPAVSRFASLRRRQESMDAQRRAAEAEIFLPTSLRRPATIRRDLADADSQYQQIARQAKELEGKLDTVRAMLGNVPYLVRWLGADAVVRRELSSRELELFNRFLEGAWSLRSDQLAEGIDPLAKMADGLRKAAEQYARDALRPPVSWSRARAALELPFLDADWRRRLLELGYESDQSSSAGPLSDRQPANPFPIWRLVPGLADEVSSDSPLANRAILDPSWDKAMTVLQVTANAASRQLRARAGTEWLRLLQRWRGQITSSVTDPWQAEVAIRITSAFRTNSDAEPQTGTDLLTRLRQQELERHLEWQLGRLRLDSAIGPDADEAYAPTLRAITRSMRDAGLSATVDTAPARRGYSLLQTPQVAIEPTDAPTRLKELILRVKADRPQVKGQQPRLGLAWDQAVVHVELPSSQANDGRAYHELRDPQNDVFEVKLLVRASDVKNVDKPFTTEIHPWVETPPAAEATADRLYATLDRLPAIPITRKARDPRLLVKLAGETISGELPVPLYPNTADPLVIQMDKLAGDIKDWRVKLESGTKTQNLALALPMGEPAESLPTAVLDPEINLAIADSTLVLRLFRGPTEIDRRKLVLQVLRPAEFATAVDEPIYDRLSRKFTIRMRLRNAGAVRQEVPVGLSILEVPDKELEESSLLGRLSPTSPRAVELTATIPQKYAERESLTALVSIGGVARALRYRIVPGRECQLLDALDVRIAEPRAGIKLLANREPPQLPIVVHADASPSQRTELRVLLHLVNDEKEADNLNPATALSSGTYPDGRKVEIRLRGEKEKGYLLSSTVSDVAMTLDTERMLRKKVVVAEAFSPQASKRALASLYFLPKGFKPDLSIKAGEKISLGQDETVELAITASPFDWQVLDRLQIGVDAGEKNGQLDDAEVLRDLGGAQLRNGPATLRLSLPTKEVAAAKGRATLLVKSTINVEGEKAPWQATFQHRFDVIEMPKPSDDDPTALATITVEVYRGTSRFDRVVVTVKEGNLTLPEGQFVFKAPAGSYTIQAEDLQKTLAGTNTIAVKAGEKATVRIDLRSK